MLLIDYLGEQIKVNKIIEALECVRILMGTREWNIPLGKILAQMGR